MSAIILGMLNLTQNDVGRFRDAHISKGKIAIYTRNGGGNRDCWHADDPKWGNETCKHHVTEEDTDELVEVKEGTLTRYQKTGKRIMEKRYVCEEPNSGSCSCPGCTINYRLPKHPNYLSDTDDDFDSTYATIYFSIPERFKELASRLESGAFKPDQRWQEKIDEIGRESPEQLKAKYPEIVNVIEDLVKQL